MLKKYKSIFCFLIILGISLAEDDDIGNIIPNLKILKIGYHLIQYNQQ